MLNDHYKLSLSLVGNYIGDGGLKGDNDDEDSY